MIWYKYIYIYIYTIFIIHMQHFPAQESSQISAWLSSCDSARHCQNFLGRRRRIFNGDHQQLHRMSQLLGLRKQVWIQSSTWINKHQSTKKNQPSNQQQMPFLWWFMNVQINARINHPEHCSSDNHTLQLISFIQWCTSKSQFPDMGAINLDKSSPKGS